MKTQILDIAIKVFGLYYFVQFAKHLIEFIFMMIGNNMFDNGQIEGRYIYFVVSVTWLIELTFAYIAIFKTELIMSKIPFRNDGSLELNIPKIDILEIALALISVVAIVYSLPNILALIIDNTYFHNNEESMFWNRSTKNSLIQSMVTLVTGIFLLFNARNFSKLIVGRGEQDDNLDEKMGR
ncbi:MAG: hypothetical protein RIG77_15685 [Cyclobacteriaceae bacterium]